MEILLYIVLAFGGGYFAGHKNSTVTAECKSNPLIITQCAEIYPPKDDSFGATTESYISLIDQYKKCKAACVVKLP